MVAEPLTVVDVHGEMRAMEDAWAAASKRATRALYLAEAALDGLEPATRHDTVLAEATKQLLAAVKEIKAMTDGLSQGVAGLLREAADMEASDVAPD